jgi:hypothetical protein
MPERNAPAFRNGHLALRQPLRKGLELGGGDQFTTSLGCDLLEQAAVGLQGAKLLRSRI